jgi:hypothetical protein
MRLYIQDPTDPLAPFLHERILELCNGAIRGAGAFAFVTSDGVDLLLKDDVFTTFATKGTFDLIVGVDEVTNVRALTALQELSRDLPGLNVKVFYHNLGRPVFHPKFCWFRHKTKGYLVAGSGNLTGKGMRGNWEAFTVGELDAKFADNLEAQWTRWVAHHAGRLRPLDDSEVLSRAALNILRRRVGGTEAGPEAPESEAAEDLPPEPILVQDVLVAEIPAGGGRWNQANFDLHSFQNFFGVQTGAVRRVVLQHVDSSGVLCALEKRPSVAVKSRNFRFELEAASGLPYPTTGRPIAVFVRIAARTFRYRLLMPGDPQHAIVSAFLDTVWDGRPDRMRRIITTTEVIRQAWPDSPLWRMPLEVQD